MEAAQLKRDGLKCSGIDKRTPILLLDTYSASDTVRKTELVLDTMKQHADVTGKIFRSGRRGTALTTKKRGFVNS